MTLQPEQLHVSGGRDVSGQPKNTVKKRLLCMLSKQREKLSSPRFPGLEGVFRGGQSALEALREAGIVGMAAARVQTNILGRHFAPAQRALDFSLCAGRGGSCISSAKPVHQPSLCIGFVSCFSLRLFLSKHTLSVCEAISPCPTISGIPTPAK